MSLFEHGKFKLASGIESNFKIDCDYLTENDIETIAILIAKKTGRFNSVVGVPTGGNRLEEALGKYTDTISDTILVVDDVVTTGVSLRNFIQNELSNEDLPKIACHTIFARFPNTKISVTETRKGRTNEVSGRNFHYPVDSLFTMTTQNSAS